jgi:NADPH-dependent ferric siderophore reductase
MTSPALPRSPRSYLHALVQEANTIHAHLRRIVLGGPDIADWLHSPGVATPAAWIKVFPPGREGRAYTIAHIDLQRGTLTVDFVLHTHGTDSGSVSDWARFARHGDELHIAGPRDGGFALLPDTEWLWLAVDATALPAARTIIESLPRDITTYLLAVAEHADARQPIHHQGNLQVEWRDMCDLPHDIPAHDRLMQTLSNLHGRGQIWMAGEADWIKHWRSFWLNDQQLDKNRLSSKGYWKSGERDHRG